MSVNKIKHLEFIQDIINRHNSNSFQIKGWTITIISAIFALSGSIGKPFLSLISLGIIFVFWILDSMFLANERCFISLYNCVNNNNKLKIKTTKLKRRIRERTSTTNKKYVVNDLSMNFKQFKEISENNWNEVFFSKTIIWFYLSLISLTLIIYLCFSISSLDKKQVIDINANISNLKELKLETRKQIIINDTINKKK